MSVSTEQKAEAGPYSVTDTATVSASGESVDAEGRSVQTTQITLSREGAIELGKEMEGYGVKGTGYTGAEIGYSVTAPAGVDPRSIDPLRPETWPEGVSVRFDESFYAGYGLESSFRGMTASFGQEVGAGQYVDVSKGADGQVVVLVGDEQFSRGVSAVGFGNDTVNVKAGATNEVAGGNAREVIIDLSSEEGRRTYESILMGGGSVPEAGTKGVVDVADLQVINASSSVDASVTVDDITVGGNLAEWNAGGVQRTHADGTTSLDWTGEKGGVQVGGTARFDAEGDPLTRDNTYYMRMEGVTPEAARQYNQIYLGEDVTPDSAQNVVLTFDHTDLQSMRVDAARAAAAQINADPEYYHDFPGAGERTVTTQDVLAHMKDNPDNIIDIPGGSGATQSILMAQSDQEILRAMMADPLAYQVDLAGDYHTATGETADPRGEVTSRESASY